MSLIRYGWIVLLLIVAACSAPTPTLGPTLTATPDIRRQWQLGSWRPSR